LVLIKLFQLHRVFYWV